MYVFHYEPQTGAYVGSTPCDFDPLEPGRVLVPAWATATPVPAGSLDRVTHHPFYDAAADGWKVLELAPAAPEA